MVTCENVARYWRIRSLREASYNVVYRFYGRCTEECGVFYAVQK